MKKFSPSKSASASGSTSHSTRQLPPRQQLIHPESQSPSHQQQQQQQPVQPWSAHRLNLVPPTLSKNAPPSGPPPLPFPRHGHSLSATASAASKLFLFGGYAHNSLRNDLYVISTGDLTVTLLKTTGEVPIPRAGHVCARIGDVLLIWGGFTNIDDQGWFIGPYDNPIYLLNLVSREWTRVVVNGPAPDGRSYPAATMVGSKLFVFGGGYNSGTCLNDMWAFDLKTLKSNPVWESYEPAFGGQKPPPRDGHVLLTIGDRIILFGGYNGQYYYNDTWSFDILTRKWSELHCTGYTPSPRCGHAAAVVDDIMYVFGGYVSDSDDSSVNDLLAFKLSTQRWFTIQNMGPSPSRRGYHAMASDGTRVFVLGGLLSEIAQEDETALIHVMDTKYTKYPNSDPNNIKPSEEITRLAWKSSVKAPTLEEDDNGEGPAEYRAKLGMPDASFEGEAGQSELEQLLSATLAALTKQRLAQPTDEQREHADRLLAQTSLVEQKDAELVEMRAKLDELLLSHDQQVRALEQALQEATSRAEEAEERSRRSNEQIALEEQKGAELVGVRAKLDELLLSHDQQVCALEQALQKATSRAANADERSRLAYERYETELAAVRLRLMDAENGLAESKREADRLRASALTTTDFVSTNEDRITRETVRRIQAMDAETEWSDKNSVVSLYRNEG